MDERSSRAWSGCPGSGGGSAWSLEQRREELDALDGQDNAYTYRLIAYPSERYRPIDS
jgi:hypothetical protein